jgi:hypothetical protein
LKKITPLLIFCPLGIIFLVYKIIEISNADGMKPIVLPILFSYFIVVLGLLILDRFLVNKINNKKIIIGELVLILLILFIFIQQS